IIKTGHLVAISVERQGFSPCCAEESAFANTYFRRLAPAGMINSRIDVGKEAVFLRGHVTPGCLRLVFYQCYPHDGFYTLEAVLPRDHQTHRRPVLVQQSAAIKPRCENRQRMTSFIKPQAFDIGPIQRLKQPTALSGYLLWPHHRFERDVLCAAKRLDLVENAGKRETDPRNYHRPGFNAAHTIDALFQLQGHQVVEVEGRRL